LRIKYNRNYDFTNFWDKLMLVGMVMMPTLSVASGSQVYSEAGSYSFTVPFGVSSITIETSGGAGGGASGWTYIVEGEKQPTYTVAAYGGDGGSSATATSQVSVTPNSEVTIVVGAGGAGGTAPGSGTYYVANPGAGGGDSYATYSGVDVVRADAGAGGTRYGDGAGGLASTSTGDTKTNGVAGDGGAGGLGNTQSGTAGIDGTVTVTW